MNVEKRIGRAFAAETDPSAVQTEASSGKIIIALNEISTAGKARGVGKAANLQIRGPVAIDPKADNLKITPFEFEIELPRMECCRLDNFLLIEASFADIELGHSACCACPAKLEAALVEPEVTRNGSATRIPLDLQGTGNARCDIVAIEEKRLVCIERQIEQRLAGREGDASTASDGSAASRLARDLAENERRAGKRRLGRRMLDHHS